MTLSCDRARDIETLRSLFANKGSGQGEGTGIGGLNQIEVDGCGHPSRVSPTMGGAGHARLVLTPPAILDLSRPIDTHRSEFCGPICDTRVGNFWIFFYLIHDSRFPAGYNSRKIRRVAA